MGKLISEFTRWWIVKLLFYCFRHRSRFSLTRLSFPPLNWKNPAIDSRSSARSMSFHFKWREKKFQQLINFQKKSFHASKKSSEEEKKAYLERFTVSLHTFFWYSSFFHFFIFFSLNKMKIKRNFLKRNLSMYWSHPTNKTEEKIFKEKRFRRKNPKWNQREKLCLARPRTCAD